MLDDSISLGDLELTKYILHSMECAGVANDTHYVRLIHASGSIGDVDGASEFLQRMKDKKVRMDHPSAFAQAMWVYCATDNMADALRLFEEVRKRGLALEDFAPRMLGVLAQHNMEEAMNVLRHDGPQAGADAYAVVAQVMQGNKELERGITLFREVERLRLPLTRDTVLIAVKLFSKAGHVQTALKWVQQLEKEGEKVNTEMDVAVLAMLLYHGMMQAAHDKIKELRQKGKLTLEVCNVMVKWLVKRGHINEALQMVTKQMKEDGIKPNAESFEALMKCTEIGRLEVLYSPSFFFIFLL